MAVIDSFLSKGLPPLVEKDTSKIASRKNLNKSQAPTKKTKSLKNQNSDDVQDRVNLSNQKYSKSEIQQKLADRKLSKTSKPSE